MIFTPRFFVQGGAMPGKRDQGIVHAALEKPAKNPAEVPV